jgi:ArsR family transcriptional regulator
MDRLTAAFEALADPTRLRILLLLREMELAVGELAQVLGQSQPRVSRHVRILADAGFVDRRKEGAWTFVALGPAERIAPALAAMDAWGTSATDAPWPIADVARLAAVRAERASAAERYFASQAERWDAIRSLHISEDEVEAAVRRAVGDRPIGRLIDIGTGTGRMLELFAADADDATGFDRSADMLRLARAKLDAAAINAELRQADMYALPHASGGADTVILHQVLHYAQQPARVVAEAARLLNQGGRLVIVDFAPHEREELRERDAHARLGFTDRQPIDWMAAAGLDARVFEHLTGGALTVTLWIGERPAAADEKIRERAA